YPAIGYASHVPEHIALEKAVDLVREWTSRCESTHSGCRRGGAPEHLPKRVVDVVDGVRLVDTIADGSTVEVEPYLTLSHCWGSRKSAELLLKTTQHNIRQHHQQIPWADIPPLFRDAISLVRALGHRYIWIDSLCIIQGDDEDWMTESAAMAEIYSNAVLNIAGTAMRNSMSGLFRPRIHGQGFRDLRASNGDKSAASLQGMVLERGALDGDTIFARISHDRSHEVLYGDMGFFRTAMEPMLNRAWVFQERLLSRRTLHFSASEVLWECRTCCLCECTGMDRGHDLSVRSLNARGKTITDTGGYSLPTSDPSRLFQPKKVLFSIMCSMSLGDRPRELLDFWLRLIEEYSFLMLSHQTDRPFALGGIAKRVQSLIPSHKYLAGLWSLDLARALLWMPYPNKTVIRAGSGTPTWSWMTRVCFPRMYGDTTTCAIRYGHVIRHEFEPDARIKIHLGDTFCEYHHGNSFGWPIAGQIALSAPGMWAVVKMVRSTGRKAPETVWTGRQALHLLLQVEHLADGSGLKIPFSPDCPGASPETVGLSQRVLCVLFGGRKVQGGKSGPHYGLVLSPVAGQPDTFTRIGFFETDEEGATAFDVAPVQSVKLV
ncbi:heterokaryon incompatibility protein-domain-containing protein, partial [Rhypophila decipiens]